MKLRSFASVGLALSGLIVSITGIFLIVTGSFKTYMKIGHELFGYVFMALMLVHMVYNIKPLKNYIMSRKFRLPISKVMVLNTIIAVFVAIVTINTANNQISMRSNAEYPTIESIPLAILLEVNGFDYTSSIEALEMQNFIIPDGTVTLDDLASANHMNPKLIYLMMTKETDVDDERIASL